MKICMLGTGSILTSALSACAIIDDQVMIDVPNGAMKAMRRAGLDPKRIDLCLISHFHGDHYFDLPFFLLEQGLRNKREKPLEIVGPSGLNRRIENLFNLAYPESWDRVKANSKLKVVELEEPGLVETSILGLVINAIQMDHLGYETYGFLLNWRGKSLGYTSDTAICDGVWELLNKSDLAVVGMAFIEPRVGHMGVSDIIELTRMYANRCQIVATHMTDQARLAAPEGVLVPKDGEVITL